MRKIVHISDIHFGAIRYETLDPLCESIENIEPHVVVVTGDLTQRARRHQFEEAARFLERIPCKERVVIPGNHDVPLYNVWNRLVRPRRHYYHYITTDRYPTYADDEIIIVGIDTSRSLTVSNGRVSHAQLVEIERRIDQCAPEVCRIIAAHHPFVLPETLSPSARVGRAEMALARLVDQEVDLLLTGHRHVSWISTLGTGLLTVHAGTATSSRLRTEPNSFHEVNVDRDEITIRTHHWHDEAGAFLPDEDRLVETFTRRRGSAGSGSVGSE